MNLVKLNIISAAAITIFASTAAMAGTPPASIAQKPMYMPEIAAPFADMAAYPTPSIDTLGIRNGLSQITLAFVTSAPDGKGGQLCSPVWGGQHTLGIANPLTSDTSIFIQQSIQAYKRRHGDVSISFGGAEGSIAPYCSSAEELTSAYDTVVQAYGVRHLDFDIEQSFVVNNSTNHIDMRSQALAALQQKHQNDPEGPVDITLTLPIAIDGLTADGLNIVDSAVKSGVVLSRVNGMTMDYGTPNAQMGQAAIQAATALRGQIIQTYANHGITLSNKDAAVMIGITPMIGENDVQGETFSIDDAKEVLKFAQSGELGAPPGELSFWSLNRDLSNCSSGGSLNSCSMIPQTDYEFTGIFDKYGLQNVKADPTYVSRVPPTSGCLTEATQEGQRWDPSLIYGGPNNNIRTVKFQGQLYTAKYWTCDNNNTKPDQSGDWYTANPVARTWSSTATYSAGALVKYPDYKTGDTYLAHYWSKNDKPDSGDGAWIDQTQHTGGGTPAWSPTSAYPIDHTQVTHNGSTWENAWYANPGDEPGKTGGEWLVVTQ